MSNQAELLCPKCQAPMRSLERSGVTLERCGECGGIFLDRGEMERLAEAELGGASPSSGAATAAAETAPASQGGAPSSQALMGELMSLARQYKGRRTKF